VPVAAGGGDADGGGVDAGVARTRGAGDGTIRRNGNPRRAADLLIGEDVPKVDGIEFCAQVFGVGLSAHHVTQGMGAVP